MSGLSTLPGECLGKKTFDTRAAALKALQHRERRMGRIRGRGGSKLSAYCCRACGKWHLGTEKAAR